MKNSYGARALTTLLDLYIDAALGEGLKRPKIDDSLFDADLAIKTNPNNLDKEMELK